MACPCLGVILGLLIAAEPVCWSPTAQEAEAQAHLRGRIVGRDGVAAAGLELLVRPAELEKADGRRTYLPQEFRANTDLDGSFEVGGLERGVGYVVRARTTSDASWHDFPHLLTPAPLTPQLLASDPPLLLTFSRPHVVVQLLDEQGRPWSGPMAGLPDDCSSPASWPVAPRVLLHDVISAVAGTSVIDCSREGLRLDRGTAVFEVVAGQRYLACVLGGPFDGSVQTVVVPEDADRILIEPRACSPDDFGTAAVFVTSQGRELGTQGDKAQFVVVLQSRSGGAALLADGPHLHPSPFLFKAPPGTYRVVARGYATSEPYHGGLQRARDLGQAEAEITLLPSRSCELHLELDAGGRLEVCLAGRGNDSEFDSMPEAFGSDRSVHTVELLLVTATGSAERLLRRWKGLYQPTLVSDWPLGERHVSECLPTGRANLVARTKSGRELRVEVALTEGKTTAVDLSF